ncbi:MAG: hypothetical protein N2234_06065, partial [Planctomycetota bacterium]|nr:hypothetical protein [Planctomycetota bacterium]
MKKVLFFWLVLVFVPLYGGEEELPPFPGLRSKEFIEADFDALLSEWAKFIEENPDSFEAVFVLSRITGYSDRMGDWRTVEPALEKALSAELLNGFISFSYKEALGWIYNSKGLRERRENLNPYEGIITDWFYVGGFGTELGNGAVFETYPPEREILGGVSDVFKKRYETDERGNISWWRKISIKKPVEAPSVYLRQSSGITYAFTQFESPSERKAILWLHDLSGYMRVFVNGHSVFEYDSERFRKPNFATIGIHLNKGYNNILIKTTSSFISVFLCDEKGFSLKGLKFEDEMVLRPVQSGENPVLKDGYEEGLLAHYEKRYERRRDDPDTAIAYALLLEESGMEEKALEVLEEMLKKCPDDPILCYFGAHMYEKASHCPASWRQSQARSLIDASLKKKENFVLAREMLADMLMQNDKHEEAVKELNKIFELGIKRVATYRQLENICSQKEWVKDAIEAVKSAESINPNDSWVLSYWKRYYEERGNLQKAREYEKRYCELYNNSDSYSNRGSHKWFEARIAEEDGDVERALEIYEEFAKQDPTDVERKLEIARFLDREGRSEEALRHYKMLLEEHCDEVSSDIISHIARLYVNLGDTKNALDWYRKALLFSPNDWTTRRYIQFLKGEDEDSIHKKYLLSEEEVKRMLKESPTDKEYPRSGVLTLLEEEVTLVLPTGATSTFMRTIEKLLKEEAKDELGSAYAAGEMRVLRTITPDGDYYEPTPSGRSSFAMTNLSKGAFVEQCYRRDGYYNIGMDTVSWHSDYFRSFRTPYHYKRSVLVFLDERLSEEDVKFGERLGKKVVYPVDKMKLRLRNFSSEEKVSFKSLKEKEATAYIFEAKELDVEEVERYVPSLKEIFPNYEFVNEDVCRTKNLPKLKAALREQSVLPTRLIKEEALRITEGAKSDIEKVMRLYEWCNLNLREGSYSDDSAHAILINKAGNRNTLFRSFVKALEIPHKIVLASVTPSRSPVERWWNDDLSSNFGETLLMFTDGKGKDYYITLSARYAPFGKLPEKYQGAPAFVVSEEEMRLIFLPKEELKERLEQKVVMEIDLVTQTCKGRYEYLGAESYNYKDEFAKRSRDDLKREMEELLGARFAGMELIEFDLPNLRDVGTPLVIKFTCSVPSVLVERKDGAFDLNYYIAPLRIQEQVAGKAERKYP